MRRSSKTVTFTRPFTLTGLDEMQPAGRYTIEVDEEQLPTVLQAAYRRTATWLTLPAHTERAGVTEQFRIDPVELDAALAKDAPGVWSVAAESHIDEMLGGSVMKQAVRSSGLTLSEFKEQLRDLAARISRKARIV